MLIFDLESDGLLDTVSKIHCINMIDTETGERLRFNGGKYGDGSGVGQHDGSIQNALNLLDTTPRIAGQNVIKYDIPVLAKLFGFRHLGKVFDTRVASQVIWTNLIDLDFSAIRTGKRPEGFQQAGLIGSHSLKAWGQRLGEYKGDFNPKDTGHTWATCPFTKEMDDYCMRDCEVTLKWIEMIESRKYSQECLDLEMEVATIIATQERRGFRFDVKAAEKLTAGLMAQRAELDSSLTSLFPPWLAKKGHEFTPKRANKKLGYIEGASFHHLETLVFNPGSRDHIADRLMQVHGWKPQVFTGTGKPQIDETVLASLPYPEAKKLTEYLTIGKRLGQVAEGKQAWLKAVKPDGRIHGSVNTNGAVTGRMTHSSPNVAQADKLPAMRALWVAPKGMKLVGCDAEGLELRMLGHYMAQWDHGAYAKTVVEGKKEDGTDVHTVNQNAIGLHSRNNAKTFVYALIYGAGDYKLGTVVLDDFDSAKRASFLAKYPAGDKRKAGITLLGRSRRAKLMSNLPALAKFTTGVKLAVKKRGSLKGLDGRRLHIRSEHAALNTLLQSAGAVAMKKALVLFADAVAGDPALRDHVHLVANVHDEAQMETTPDVADKAGQTFADCIRKAGEHFKLRCPLSGAYAVGTNWSETH